MTEYNDYLMIKSLLTLHVKTDLMLSQPSFLPHHKTTHDALTQTVSKGWNRCLKWHKQQFPSTSGLSDCSSCADMQSESRYKQLKSRFAGHNKECDLSQPWACPGTLCIWHKCYNHNHLANFFFFHSKLWSLGFSFGEQQNGCNYTVIIGGAPPGQMKHLNCPYICIHFVKRCGRQCTFRGCCEEILALLIIVL